MLAHEFFWTIWNNCTLSWKYSTKIFLQLSGAIWGFRAVNAAKIKFWELSGTSFGFRAKHIRWHFRNYLERFSDLELETLENLFSEFSGAIFRPGAEAARTWTFGATWRWFSGIELKICLIWNDFQPGNWTYSKITFSKLSGSNFAAWSWKNLKISFRSYLERDSSLEQKIVGNKSFGAS